MPCNGDYLNPTTKERELQRTATLLIFVKRKLGKPVAPWLTKEAKDNYAKRESVVPQLCREIERMTTEQRERILYDAHDKDSRDLANWWETHQAADTTRKKKESDVKRAERRRKKAERERSKVLSRLSKKERKALGVT